MRTRILTALILLSALAAVPAFGGLIGYYQFEGNLLDSSGHGNHGTWVGGAPAELAPGYSGQAYYFDVVGGTISIPIDINPAVLPQVTFGGWVHADVVDTLIRGIISNDDGDYDRTLDMDDRADGTTRWCAFNGTGVTCTGRVIGNSWTFLALRYDAASETASLTVDGMTSTFSATPGSSIETTTRIGRNPHFDDPFVGMIDNVFFYDEYLSDLQIIDLRNNGVATGVPEPATFALIGAALVGLALLRRR